MNANLAKNAGFREDGVTDCGGTQVSAPILRCSPSAGLGRSPGIPVSNEPQRAAAAAALGSEDLVTSTKTKQASKENDLNVKQLR